MKSLALDETGDLLFEGNVLQMVEGNDLKVQTIREVISTNKGEWAFDWEQGIEFSNILGKNVEEDAERLEITDGLQQVDEDLLLSEFSKEVTDRTTHITFKAVDDSDTELDISTDY